MSYKDNERMLGQLDQTGYARKSSTKDLTYKCVSVVIGR